MQKPKKPGKFVCLRSKTFLLPIHAFPSLATMKAMLISAAGANVHLWMTAKLKQKSHKQVTEKG